MIKKIIGYSLISSVFLFLFLMMTIVAGFLKSLIVFSSAIVLTIIIVVGIGLAI